MLSMCNCHKPIWTNFWMQYTIGKLKVSMDFDDTINNVLGWKGLPGKKCMKEKSTLNGVVQSLRSTFFMHPCVISSWTWLWAKQSWIKQINLPPSCRACVIGPCASTKGVLYINLHCVLRNYYALYTESCPANRSHEICFESTSSPPWDRSSALSSFRVVLG